MMFADSSSATVAGLQQVFAIDRAMAEMLLREVPVVVKRAATPNVAAALIDALQKLGAQVVLLPSSGASTNAGREPDVLVEAAESAPRWGGLDLTSQRPRAPTAEFELDPEPTPVSSSERSDGEPSDDAVTSVEQTLYARRPSVAPFEEVDTEGEAVMASRAEDFVSGSEADLFDTEVPSIPPLFDEPMRSSLEGNEIGTRDRASLAGPSSQPSPEPSTLRRMPMHAHVDLGLGTVPPLPSLESARPGAPPVPPPVPRTAQHLAVPPPPPVQAQARKPSAMPVQFRAQARVPEAEPFVELPEIDETARTPPRNPAQAASRLASGDAYWTARRSSPPEPEAPRSPSSRPPQRSDEDEAAPPFLAGPSSRPPAPAASVRPAAAHPRGLALVELLGGVLVLYLGVRFDNSVLYGNATLASLLLHGLAFYGIGGGIVGLWP
jgi:hypothetical protein